MVKFFDYHGAKSPLFNSQWSPKINFALLLALLQYLTHGAGAVDDKDLAVSSDQGNT